jgi:hypothetical protein
VLGDRGVELALATGVVDAGGARHRRVLVRPPTGRQEGRFDDAAWAGKAEDELDEVVRGAVERLGGYAADEVTAGLLGLLTRGDVHRVLLALRALLDGDELRLSARCPNPDCAEVAEVVLSVAEILGPEPAAPVPAFARLAGPDADLLVHLPRAADDAAARADRGTADAAWARLVARAQPAEEGGDPTLVPLAAAEWAALPVDRRVAVAEALATLLERAGPETALIARCPRCAAWIEMELDPADVLARALRASAARLPAEVHVLAYHYGWTEGAVLDLPRARRHRYLDLLGRELEGRPLTDAGGWLA